ncbi:MerR family transcriptional regulator [Catenulispora sp. NL8]|uniref:MerR family transcriptional regulator n=1 Tax=Catenulispora pinistramenti TaxID=2705254 RepID=A0ABS5L5G1_9ACTN|nr:MerR family transcriptional regulator [Catenulispora pinistramenti]MBS2553587.1 MerR family transcriptional regulator [Catenulispora pinistramenti]
MLSIGEFSRLTHVSVKALRHYHDVDLLPPARIDPDSGYRFYATAQAPTAQLIRRFRDLGMPLDQVKLVLAATDPAARDELIADHLRSMERQLEQTQTAVSSLRRLLEGGGPPALDVTFHSPTATPALTVTARLAWNDVFRWLPDTLTDLRRRLGADAGLRGGPDGAFYSAELFESHIGEVTAFIPLTADAGLTGAARRTGPTGPAGETLPEGPMAVAVHNGPLRELDRTYAALGSFVAEQSLGSHTRTAIRENYLVGMFDTKDEHSLVTEVCWPVLSTRGEKESS